MYHNTNPIQPFRHHPVARPHAQFVGGLIPLDSVISTIQQGNYIQPSTAAPAALPVGWLIALGGAYIAYQMASSREGLAIGVALAMIAGEAAYEILSAIGKGSSPAPASSSS